MFCDIDMNKYKKPKIDEGTLGKNPFVSSLKIKVSSVVSKDKFRYDKKDDVWMNAEQDWESVSFTRIYSDSERRLQMAALKASAKELLLWLMYECETGKDWMWINKVRYMEENNINSINTYKSALNELIRTGYITKTVIADVFWINPHFFFNGNRIKCFPENIIK